MDKVLINLNEENETIRGLFEPREYISVDNLLDKIDELASEVESLKLTIEELTTEYEEDEDL